MNIRANQAVDNKITDRPKDVRSQRCLSCGTTRIEPRRRYCSSECHRQIDWVLSLSKGLLRTFNARYATFSYTNGHIILDILPVWSKVISRFSCQRTPGNKPADDLKNLVLQSGKEWHNLVCNNSSRSKASLTLLRKNHNKQIDPRSIKPKKNERLRLSIYEKRYLKILNLKKEDLPPDAHLSTIKSAYKKMAKLYHPDTGGDEEKFKQLNEAHKQMIVWADNPQYLSRKALPNCWSYDGFTNRWSPPL